MERNRESRRGTAAVSSGFSSSRRRSRGSGEVEDGGNDSLTDRSRRDRPSRRRRRSSNESFHVDREDVGDGSSDESLDEEHEDEDEPMQGGSGNSSLRRTGRGKPQWKGSDEVIGVSVPRKARSASAKRSQDPCSTARLSSSSSPARTAASLSPPSSNASMKASRRVKPATTKTKPPKTSKVSISESEVEVAQFLFGLRRQSQSPPAKPDATQSLSPSHDVKHNLSNEGSLSIASKSSSPMSTPISPPSCSRPMVLPQHSSPTQAPTVTAPKRKKPRAVQPEGSGNPPIMLACSSKPSSTLPGNSISPVAPNPSMEVEADKEHLDVKAEILSPKSDTNAEANNSGSPKAETSIPKDIPLSEEKLSPSSPVETKSAVLPEVGLHSTVTGNTELNRSGDADGQPFMDQNNPMIRKELISSTHDLPPVLTTDVKLEDSKMTSTTTATVGVKGPKFEIDLMAPPENCFPDDCMPDASERSAYNEPGLAIDDISMKSKGITNPSVADREEVKVNQDCSRVAPEETMQAEEAVEAVTLLKHTVSDKKTESGHDEITLDRAGNKQHSQKNSKSTARQIEKTAPPIGIMTSSAAPIPVQIPSWPGGLPPFGYLSSSPANLSGLPTFQGGKPVEGNSAMPNPPFVMLPHPRRPNRCAAHLFIAHFIHYQQQLARLNPFWHAAGSTALYGARPYNMNILPPSDALLLGSSIVRNPNMPASNDLGSGSVVALNSHGVKEKAPNMPADAQRKQHLPLQSAQQGAAFMFPFTQPRAGESKSSTSADNSGLMSASAASATASASKFSNIGTTSDAQFMTMLPGNYPFPIPPSYRAHMNPQQQSVAPFFGGSFYPSQLMRLQSHSLQTQISTTSTGSLSSQKHLQAQQCLPASITKVETLRSDPEPTGNREVSLSQKKPQAHNFSGHPSLTANFPPNFPVMATALDGKQQPPSDPSLQMSLKAMDVVRPVLPGHAMLQSMPDVGHNHYQLGHQLQIHSRNLSKTQGKVATSARASDKSPETIHSQSPAAAVQQLQKQAMAQAKPSTSALSTAAATGGTAYTDRVPVVYSNAGSNLAPGSMGFPTMQLPPQWKLQGQRLVQAGPSANAIGHPGATAAVMATPSSGSSSGKLTKLPSSPANSSRKAVHSGSPVLSQSSQAQTLGKTQQLFSNSEPVHHAGSTGSSQKWHGDPNLSVQPMFPGSLNIRRPINQHKEQGSSVLTVASSSSFLAGGVGKGPTVYSPLASSSVAVMAGASYVKSAANLPVKSAEQKPATA